MVDDEKEKRADENLVQAARTDMLARALGYNELAKKAVTLGEKTYYRVARDMAVDKLRALGGTLDFTRTPILITLPGHNPEIAFNENDIELMREAVKRADEDRR